VDIDATPNETPADQQPSAGSSRQPEQPSRRELLRRLGLAAAVVAPFPFGANVLNSVIRTDNPIPMAPTTEEEPTEEVRLRRWAMVIDLRYCDGCQGVNQPPQCTLACIEGHFAPEPMEWIEIFEEHQPIGDGTTFRPIPCQHCQNPPCTNVCPVGATFSTPEGMVLIDQERCIGCRICMAACPYDRRFFNWGDPPTPPEAKLADYSTEHQTPGLRGTVMKCDFCPDMARTGRLPYCAQACPNNAIYYGDLEEGLATNGRTIVNLERFLIENDAERLKEDLGTEPRVFYLPGHGELAGRDPSTKGRIETEWPWQEQAGVTTWSR
jgi:Fe-S-cluster-containing dehydrogenase component